MPMLFNEYLSPTNPIAFGIVTFLICLFVAWLIGLIINWYRLRQIQIYIQKNQSIRILVTARQERDNVPEDNDQEVAPENVFRDFCGETRLDKRSPIAEHLKAIFLAGWNQSRLEVGELINHTTSNLFKLNNLLRSGLAVFIVIGLLGTLFGLTDSLTELSPALNESAVNEASTDNRDGMTKVLSELFDTIKGAFAPSIWGIIFTIIGVIIYGFYLHIACHPVKSILEQSTLTVWIPQLYPTTSQKLIQTLQKSESQIEKGLETAAQFSESVNRVDGKIDGFIESLTQASDLTELLSNSVTQINKAASNISTAAEVINTSFTESLDTFSKEFTSNVNNLTGFQDEIRKLHQQFQDTANENLDRQSHNLEEQNKNLAATLDVLKNYERFFVDVCQQIDATLQTFLNQINAANTNIEANNREFLNQINITNREWIKEIQDQLKTDLAIIQPTLKDELKKLTDQLTSDLKEVQSTLDKRLEELTNQLKFFQLPIEKTADQIEGTIEGFTRIMEGIVNALKSEFQKQSKSIEEQNKNYEKQLTESQNLSANVKSLLEQLDESSSNQKSAVNELSTNVGVLTQGVENLDNTIKAFTRVEKADVTPFTASIEKLDASINEISEHSRTLANAVNTLGKQESPSRSEQKPKGTQESSAEPEPKPKPSVFGRIRNRFSRRKTDGQSSKSQNSNGEE